MVKRLLVLAAVLAIIGAGVWIARTTRGESGPANAVDEAANWSAELEPPVPESTADGSLAGKSGTLVEYGGPMLDASARRASLKKTPAEQVLAAENQAQRRFLLKKLLEESDSLAEFEESGIREAIFEWLGTVPQSYASGHLSREVVFDLLNTIFESGKPWAAEFALNLALDPATGDVREEYFATGLGHTIFRSIYASLFHQGTPEAREAIRELYTTMNEGPHSGWGFPHAAVMLDYAADSSAEGSDELFWEMYEGLTPEVRRRYLNWYVFNDLSDFSSMHGEVFQELLHGSDPEWRDPALGMLVSFGASRVQGGAETPSLNAAALEQLYLEGNPEQQAALLNDVASQIEGRMGGRGTSINPGALDTLLEQAAASDDPAVQQARQNVQQRLDAVADARTLVQEVNEVLTALQELKR